MGRLQKVRAEMPFEKLICPYCYEKLGIRERVQRKILGIYRCSNCHRQVDSRFIIK